MPSRNGPDRSGLERVVTAGLGVSVMMSLHLKSAGSGKGRPVHQRTSSPAAVPAPFEFAFRSSEGSSRSVMESTLHRQLKELYAPDADGREVRLAGYRIDAIVGEELVEIQQSSLGALRRKVARLLETHRVRVVKPLAITKTIAIWDGRQKELLSLRQSPKHEAVWSVFEDLVHFVDVFPHERLELDIVLTTQQEDRVKRRARRWRGKDYRVLDRHLVEVVERVTLATRDDLWSLLPPLAEEFTTGDLATAAGMSRWIAQKAAYCLRKTGAAEMVGRTKAGISYRRIPTKKRRSRRAA